MDHHHSHGWHGDVVPADWSPLDEAAAGQVLAGFADLRGPVAVLWCSPRPFSAAARVQTSAGEVFIKRQDARIRNVKALAEEHAFIAHLRTQGLPVPQVLRNDAGQSAIPCGSWVYEVHLPAAGLDLYLDTPSWTPLSHPALARNAGRMLARLHLAATRFPLVSRSATVLVARDDVLRAPELVDAIAAQCRQRPALAAFLSGRDWRADVAPLQARHRQLQPRIARLPRLWTHGDWHASNLCWSDASASADVAGILDFGLCAPTFALYDLATAIERNAIAWLSLGQGTALARPRIAQALIDGYAEVTPLDASQRQLLAELLPLVHLDFALSEVEYFHAITGKPADAAHAWEGFFLGHAQWFDTSDGQSLLQAILRTP